MINAKLQQFTINARMYDAEYIDSNFMPLSLSGIGTLGLSGGMVMRNGKTCFTSADYAEFELHSQQDPTSQTNTKVMFSQLSSVLEQSKQHALSSDSSMAIGGFAIGNNSVTIGYQSRGQYYPDVPFAIGNGSLAAGALARAAGRNSACFGSGLAEGDFSLAAAGGNAYGYGSFSTGGNAYGMYARSSGNGVSAMGDFSEASGHKSYAAGTGSRAEGYQTSATGGYAHSEGYNTAAAGEWSHTEGYGSKAEGMYSHAEGYKTTAAGNCSHCQGRESRADGDTSFTRGQFNSADGNYSIAEGWCAATRLPSVISSQDGLPVVAGDIVRWNGSAWEKDPAWTGPAESTQYGGLNGMTNSEYALERGQLPDRDKRYKITGPNGTLYAMNVVEKGEKADYSYVWNPIAYANTRVGARFYTAHGAGTFNVNPLDGLSGFYIGEKSLASHMSGIVRYADTEKISAGMADFLISVDNMISSSRNVYDRSTMFDGPWVWYIKKNGKAVKSDVDHQYAAYYCIDVPVEAGKTYNIWYNSTDNAWTLYNAFLVDDNDNIISVCINNTSTKICAKGRPAFAYQPPVLSSFTVPVGATRFLASSTSTSALFTTDMLMINEGAEQDLHYQPYFRPFVVSADYRYRGMERISAEKTDFITVNKERVEPLNQFQMDLADGPAKWYRVRNEGGIPYALAEDDTLDPAGPFGNFYRFNVPVEAGKTYTLWMHGMTTPGRHFTNFYNLCLTDDAMRIKTRILSTYTPVYNDSTSFTFTVPDGATRLAGDNREFGWMIKDGGFLVLNEGTQMITRPEPESGRSPYVKNVYVYRGMEDAVTQGSFTSCLTSRLSVVSHEIDKLDLRLPRSVNVLSSFGSKDLAGCYAQIFWKDCVNGELDDGYSFVVHNAGGFYTNNYGRMLDIIGYQKNIYNVTIDVYNRDHQLIQSESISVNNMNQTELRSPEQPKTVLMVGDSLANSGEWCGEFMRMLTKSDGAPRGLGLSGFSSIGSRFVDDANFEGAGGWTYTNYNTAFKSASVARWFTCEHSLTDADLMAVYRETTKNEVWRVVEVKPGKVKMHKNASASSVIPASGTFAHISGGNSSADIVYTGTEEAVANPFWDEDTAKVDFQKYAQRRGAESIDYCYVLLGWNNIGSTKDALKAMAQQFIDNVHTAYPDCQVMLIGLQHPSKDGCGANWRGYDSTDYMKAFDNVYKVEDAYLELEAENANVHYVCLAPFFDSEYGYPTATMPVNSRSSVTQTYQNNGVHPNSAGQKQIADVVLRDFIGRI